MAEIRNAHGKGEMQTRLNLFPPSGKRIHLRVKNYHYDGGVLHYTDLEGIKCDTTLRYAIEEIPEGYQKTTYHER